MFGNIGRLIKCRDRYGKLVGIVDRTIGRWEQISEDERAEVKWRYRGIDASLAGDAYRIGDGDLAGGGERAGRARTASCRNMGSLFPGAVVSWSARRSPA